MGIYKDYFKKYKLPFMIATLCVTLEAFCDLLAPTLMANIINSGIQSGQLAQVLYWGIRMLLVTAAGAGFAVARSVLASYVSQRVGADLRADLFRKIVRFSEESVDKIESGSLITRLSNDSNQIVLFVNGMMRIFLKAPVTCIGSIVLATALNFRLSLFIYAVVAVVAALIFASMRLSYPRFSKLQSAMDRVNSVVQEYLIGVRLVKAFGTYGEEVERFEDANKELMWRGISSQMVITLISPLLSLTVGLGTVLVIYAGSRLFPVGLAGIGDISAFTIYMAQILSSLLMISNVFNIFVRTKASTARITAVFECGEDFSPGEDAKTLGGDIVFDHVTFAYPGGSGVPALKDLSFAAKDGETLAVIGPTGSGKSTIAWLLLRFYDVTEGRILLGGEDIKTLGCDTVRRSVSIVPQKPALFSGSAEENIRWGKPDALQEQIVQAAERAQAAFLERMEDGFNSRIASGGVNLSGGQRQRLSIARGLLKDAPVLVLDDATSALDAITEAKVRREVMSGEPRTILLITQRCATAMFADRILVLENGSCAGTGTHAELLESCAVYRDIYHSQIESGRGA